jgi:hypothetical protein
LSTTDLIINTETGIALTETGRYDSSTSAAIQLPSA